MRRALVLAATSCLAIAACVDLFHDTDVDLVDAGAADAPLVRRDANVEADSAPPIEFCELSVDDGKALAQRACALLGACASPVGQNSMGNCLERALPAMACKGAPDMPVRGGTLAYYRCLAGASSCEAVERCVFGEKPTPTCGTAKIARCGLEGDGQQGVRIDCRESDTPAVGELCAGYGQRCIENDKANAFCTGVAGLNGCKKSGCDSNRNLMLCSDAGKVDAGGRDDGFACADFGTGRCIERDAGPACEALGAIQCTASGAVKCNNSVAIGCPAGVQEKADCKALFGTVCGALDGGTRERIWDVQRACEIDAGCSEACGGKKLIACVRGRATEVDCQALVGTPCELVATADGLRPRCARPSDGG